MKVLIVGTVSNVAKVIKYDLRRVNNSLRNIAEVEVFLVESDSQDNTCEKLLQLKNVFPNFAYVNLGTLSSKIPDRVERIRYCRNIYVDYIREFFAERQWDYIVVVDLDGMNSRLNQKGILTTLNSNLDWAGCFANQRRGYYDLYALRCEGWVNEDVFLELSKFKSSLPFISKNRVSFFNWLQSFRHFDTLRENAIYSKMRVIPSNVPWIRVDSAFGGLGIYKPKVFLKFNYESLHLSPVTYSEHIDLHYKCKSLSMNLFINPGLINCNWNVYNFNRIKSVRFLKEFKKFILQSN